MDHAMLLDLCAGELGELKFDLFDGDWYVFQASGESRESLFGYLHARARRDRPHRWNRFPAMGLIDARSDTVDAGAALVSQAFGWGALDCDALLQAFRTASVPTLPRRIEIHVNDWVFNEEVRERFARAQPRVQFVFRTEMRTASS
jgi:hypothetical protein